MYQPIYLTNIFNHKKNKATGTLLTVRGLKKFTKLQATAVSLQRNVSDYG